MNGTSVAVQRKSGGRLLANGTGTADGTRNRSRVYINSNYVACNASTYPAAHYGTVKCSARKRATGVAARVGTGDIAESGGRRSCGRLPLDVA